MIVDVSLTKVQTNVGIDGVIVVKENNTPSALKILTSLPFGGNRVIAMTSTGIDYRCACDSAPAWRRRPMPG